MAPRDARRPREGAQTGAFPFDVLASRMHPVDAGPVEFALGKMVEITNAAEVM